MSETSLEYSFNLPDDRTYTEGYNLLRADYSNDNKRGGVCMYFKVHLSILRCDDLCNFPECLVIETRMGKDTLLQVLLQISKSEFWRV